VALGLDEPACDLDDAPRVNFGGRHKPAYDFAFAFDRLRRFSVQVLSHPVVIETLGLIFAALLPDSKAVAFRHPGHRVSVGDMPPIAPVLGERELRNP